MKDSYNDISLYTSIKTPLLNIICQYFPYKYNLKLGYRSKHYQAFHRFSFETYKYVNLLLRSYDPRYSTSIDNLASPFISNHLNFFPIEQLRDSDLISHWLIIKEMKKKEITESAFDLIFRISLHMHHFPYIMISNQLEYDYYLKFENEFKDTLLFVNMRYIEDDNISSSFINLTSTQNIIYLYFNTVSYFNLSFPKLKFLILTQMEKSYTYDLNKIIPQLEFLMINTSNDVFLQDIINLNSIKYLSIDAECLTKNNNHEHLFAKSFPELLSFSINRSIYDSNYDQMNETLDFLRERKYNFPKARFPKIKHIDMFVKVPQSKFLPKLSVISHEWITKPRESGDITIPPLELDSTLEYWESLREVKIISNQSKLHTLEVLTIPKSIESFAFPQLSHLKISLSSEFKEKTLKTVFNNIFKTITHLNFFNITHRNIKTVFTNQFPNLTELKLSFPSNFKTESIALVLSHSSMKNLHTLDLSFSMSSITETLEQLFLKCSFDSLIDFSCDRIKNPEKCLINTHMPQLKNLSIKDYELIGDLESMMTKLEKLEYVEVYVDRLENERIITEFIIDKRESLRLSLKHLAVIIINNQHY